MKLKVKIQTAIDGTYTLISEENRSPIKKGDSLTVLTAKELSRFMKCAIKHADFDKVYEYKLPEIKNSRGLLYQKSVDKVIIWIDGRFPINFIIQREGVVSRRIGLLFKKGSVKKIYDLVFSTGNILHNVERVIFDNFKTSVEIYKLR
jgi:hypothetical protein